MGCTTGKNRQMDKYILERYADTITKISPEELNILKIIYFDLALRNCNKKIQKQTFCVFFQKNGLWGQKLFKEFDIDNTEFVCLEEFVFSTAKIIKADEKAKIKLLYEFFAFGNQDKNDGIIYADFLRVLYNYSRQQLKKILQSQYLNCEELKKELIDVLDVFEKANSGENTESNNVIFVEMKQNSQSFHGSNVLHLLNYNDLQRKKYQMSSLIGKSTKRQSDTKWTSNSIKKSLKSKKSQPETNHSTQFNQNDIPNQPPVKRLPNNGAQPVNSQQKQIESAANKVKKRITNRQESMNFQFQNKHIKIKTSSYMALVKKIAGLIFNHFGIDKKTGRLFQAQFVEWIQKHKELYESYYRGFNQHIWQIQDGKLGYLTRPSEIQSIAKYHGYIFQNGQPSKNQVIKSCKVFLQGSILFISSQSNPEQLYNTIYLEGLEVQSIAEQKLGHGIQIKHKNNIYPRKKIFFKSQVQCKNWMEHLKDYKGFIVYDKYEVGMRIGAGKYSVVYECKERMNNKRYAMKEIDTFRLTSQEKSIISHESNIMSAFDHPNLLKYRQTIKAKNKIFIITELVDGKDLLEFVKEKQYLTEFEAAHIAKQIMLGVNYLHRLGIVHRDLKPENIMIQSSASTELKVKLIDFGFANYIKNLQYLNQQDTIVGTPNYIAPQVYKKKNITEKVDIFSVGTIIYFMLSGDLPFNSQNLQFLIQRTLTQKCKFVGKKWMKVSKQAKKLIQSLLQIDPSKRISLKDALNHEWFRISESPSRKNENVEEKKSFSMGSKKVILF